MTLQAYLDNSATTEIRSEVLAAMQEYLSDKWGNPSSIHSEGRQARAAIERARHQIAKLINALPSEIFFTPGGTYSNNVALLGRAKYVEEENLGRHIVTSAIEHSSALAPATYLESRGWNVTVIGVDRDGFINLEELENALRPDTSIVSIMHANNEIGSIQPIAQISEFVKSRGIFFHSDAVQAPGKIRLDVSESAVDTMSLSGHKFYAPKGIGVLFIRQAVDLRPIFYGGGQEKGLFPGTENLANIVGIGEAAELIGSEFPENIRHLRTLQNILFARLRRYGSVTITGPRDMEKRVPGHVSLLVSGSEGLEIVQEASDRGVYLSSVSACSSGARSPSHVLKSIGISDGDAIGALRITAGIFNTVDECEYAANEIGRIIGTGGIRSVNSINSIWRNGTVAS